MPDMLTPSCIPDTWLATTWPWFMLYYLSLVMAWLITWFLYLLYRANMQRILILNGTKCHAEQSATHCTRWGPPLESVGATSRIQFPQNKVPHGTKCHTEQSATPYTWWGPPLESVGATSWIWRATFLLPVPLNDSMMRRDTVIPVIMPVIPVMIPVMMPVMCSCYSVVCTWITVTWDKGI